MKTHPRWASPPCIPPSHEFTTNARAVAKDLRLLADQIERGERLVTGCWLVGESRLFAGGARMIGDAARTLHVDTRCAPDLLLQDEPS